VKHGGATPSKQKIDIVITSARYSLDGRLLQVRAYHRFGPVWSDILLIDRHRLVEMMQRGMTVATGRRERDPGGMVVVAEVQLVEDSLVLHGKEGTGEALGVPRY
jgi:hypothetical protein